MKPKRAKFTPLSPLPLSGPSLPHFDDTQTRERQGLSVLLTFSHIPQRRLVDTLHSPVTEDDGFSDSEYDQDDDEEGVHDFQIPPQFLARLKTFPLFDKAPPSFHTRIAANLKLVGFHPQQYIIRKGDPSMSMYWILKGTVLVTSTDGESVYAELAPGAFFGEIGIMYNRPRTATVVARTRVLVGVLTSDALNVVLRNYPLIERRIRDEAQERLSMQEKQRKKAMTQYSFCVDQKVSPLPQPMAPVALQLELTPCPLIPPPSSGTTSPVTQNLACLDSTVSVKEFIMSLPVFAQFPLRIIHKIALMAEPLRARPFEYIFRKGDVGLNIYFIISGEVEVLDYNDYYKERNSITNEGEPQSQLNEKILARLGRGSYFGEISFLLFLKNQANDTRSALIRLISTTDLIVVRTETLHGLCRQYPSMVEEMRRTAEERINLNKYYQAKNRLLIDNLINRPVPSRLTLALPGSVSQLEIIASRELVGGLVSPPSVSPLPGGSPIERKSSPVERKASPLLWSQGVVSPQPLSTLFATNWLFSKIANHNKLRLVSPVSIGPSILPSSEQMPTLRKRKLVYDAPLTQLTLPPLNPPAPLVNTFGTEQLLRRGSLNQFQYLPHSKRLRLALVSQGRRRLSALANPSPLPDRLLLRVFEFIELPQLMKLRVVCRRWRQLLHAAPNLCNFLDLTPWNTIIDDKAIISITDFVGGRATYVDISNCFHVTDEGFLYLVNEIGMLGRLTTLKMRLNWDTLAMAIMDLTAPLVGQYLEELDLLNCRKVRDNVVERLIGWDDLDLVRPEDVADLEDAIDQVGCKNLRMLHLGYCKHLTDNIMLHLANHALKRLEVLDLTRCTTISDVGFQYWQYKLFPHLKKLLLKDCTFLTDKLILAIALLCQNIEILDLNFCCALTDILVEVLAMGCQQLRELDLLFCGLAVLDLLLATVLLQLAKLDRLIVKGCIRVTRAGVDALISGRAPLTYIDIRQCKHVNVYPEGVPAQTLNINPQTRLAFVRAGPYHDIIEIAL